MARKTMKLQAVLQEIGATQAHLAQALNLAPPTISLFLCHGIWPKRSNRERLAEAVAMFLRERGVAEEQIATALETEEWTPERANARASGAPKSSEQPEDDVMLLRKQALTPAARRHFGLTRDPFAEVSDASEVYANEDIRYARLSMLDKAKHGGFMAVVGESGAGKSTLRRDLIEKINRDGMPVRIIQPYVLAMGDSERKGTPLKALNIVEAILADIAPLDRIKQSHEARFRQVHAALRESARAGNKHVLIVEEAHSMPIATLKSLKRFVELEEGFTRLLSIILIGQSELGAKLSEQNAEVREVVQRCEIVTLRPLADVGDYLKFRFKLLGVPLEKVVTDDGIQALCDRLQPPAPKGHQQRSLLYPLAVHNLLAAAMNEAAAAGAPVVDGNIVREV
ncbi:Eha [plant metagenome]|uniref:Eha n=1 Tax=plant metagenome TaxID=1297885 RepID=A0A484TFI6_9ZZZZ